LLARRGEDGGSESKVLSYEAAFLGFRSALSSWGAPVFGMRSMRTARRAVEGDPLNPLAWVEFGQVTDHAPGIAGGDKNKATAYFEKALDLMEKNEFDHQDNWRILQVARLLHDRYTAENKTEKAREMEKYLTPEILEIGDADAP